MIGLKTLQLPAVHRRDGSLSSWTQSVKPTYKTTHPLCEPQDPEVSVKPLVEVFAGQIVATIAPVSGVS